jgi:LysR family nitrogen assimilation transcriptional regulator
MIEFRQLHYFVTIVDACSITQASTILHIAQPALSQQIKDLENELGVKLLHRSIKGVTPTLEGVALYSHAQKILSLRDQTSEVVKKAIGVLSGRVRLGIPSSISMILAAPLFAALKKNYPDIVLELYESPSTYLSAQLLDGRVDLSLLVDQVPAPGVMVSPLVREHILLVQSKSSARFKSRKSIDFSELNDTDFMLTTRASTLRGMVEKAFKKARISPRISAEASSIQTLLTVVADGDLSTLIPYSALSWYPVLEILHWVPVKPSITRDLMVAQCASVSLSPATQCVKELIVQVCADLVRKKIWVGTDLLVDAPAKHK